MGVATVFNDTNQIGLGQNFRMGQNRPSNFDFDIICDSILKLDEMEKVLKLLKFRLLNFE